MRLGCIDIGSNTTRLLVAEVDHGRLREIAASRHFTRIGASLDGDGAIPPEKLREVADLARRLADDAHGLGAADVSVVATAAVRTASNRDALVEAVNERTGMDVWVLSGREEAELSFHGACRAVGHVDGPLAVVDVGGGSTEIAVGTAESGVSWSESIPIGSSVLCERHLRDDPPTASQIEAAHAAVAAALQGCSPPVAEAAVAVGGTATSLHQLVGPALTREALEHGLARVCAAPAAQAAVRLGLPEQRVRLLPAGIAVLCGVADLLGPGLSVAPGGLREGLVLQRAQETV